MLEAEAPVKRQRARLFASTWIVTAFPLAAPSSMTDCSSAPQPLTAIRRQQRDVDELGTTFGGDGLPPAPAPVISRCVRHAHSTHSRREFVDARTGEPSQTERDRHDRIHPEMASAADSRSDT
jgi:hypothetical protein